MALDIIAGSVAGASGILAGYPFDTVKGSVANSKSFMKSLLTNKYILQNMQKRKVELVHYLKFFFEFRTFAQIWHEII